MGDRIRVLGKWEKQNQRGLTFVVPLNAQNSFGGTSSFPGETEAQGGKEGHISCIGQYWDVSSGLRGSKAHDLSFLD